MSTHSAASNRRTGAGAWKRTRTRLLATVAAVGVAVAGLLVPSTAALADDAPAAVISYTNLTPDTIDPGGAATLSYYIDKTMGIPWTLTLTLPEQVTITNSYLGMASYGVTIEPGWLNTSSLTVTNTGDSGSTVGLFVVLTATVPGTYNIGPSNFSSAEGIAGFAPVTLTVNEIPAPSLIIEATSTYTDTNGDGIPQVGETVQYTYTVTNDGNTVIEDAVITDPITGNPIAIGTLQPGDSVTVAAGAVYTITAADAATGQFNLGEAVVTGTAPDGSTIDAATGALEMSVFGTPVVTPGEVGTVPPAEGGNAGAGDASTAALATTKAAAATAGPVGFRVNTGGTVAGTEWIGWLTLAGIGLVGLAATPLVLKGTRGHSALHRAEQ